MENIYGKPSHVFHITSPHILNKGFVCASSVLVPGPEEQPMLPELA
jgi:hypothetical protein